MDGADQPSFGAALAAEEAESVLEIIAGSELTRRSTRRHSWIAIQPTIMASG